MIHCISYAYSTSHAARKLGHGPTGCYILTIGSIDRAFPRLSDAIAAAIDAGTEPDRWSIDHPSNARFLRH